MTVGAEEDFYLYVNEKWLNDPKNEIPEDYSTWGGFTKLHDDSLNNQITLIEEIAQNGREKNSEDENKLFAIWEASQNRFKKWKEGVEDYSPLEKEFGALKQHLSENKLAEYFAYAQINRIRCPLNIDKGNDLEDSNFIKLDISPSGLSLPSRDYYFDEKFAEIRQFFRTHLQNIFSILKSYSQEVDENFVENVVNFETKLAFITMKRDQSRKYDEYYTNTTLENFYNEINSLKYTKDKDTNYSESEIGFLQSPEQIEQTKKFAETIYEKLNLRAVLKENYLKNFGDEPEKFFTITAYDGDYFRRVFPILFDNSNQIELKSYFQYGVVSSLSSYTTEKIDLEFFDFQSKLTGQKKQKTNEKRSIALVNSYAGELIGKIYVSRHFSKESKLTVEKMIYDIIDIMKISLERNDWLTDATKAKAIDKLAKFRIKIGYPDVWKDYSTLHIDIGEDLYSILKKVQEFNNRIEFFDKLNTKVDKNEWLMTPQTVNAYFNPTQNEIVFPAAILQPPFFYSSRNSIDFDISDELDDSLDILLPANLGGIGAVIAHEITHGYDDQGRKFDGDGNLANWWSDEDVKLFQAKADVMKLQTENFKFVEVVEENGEKKTNEHRMNAQLTMGENLADLGGLSLAKQSLERSLKDANEDNKRKSLRVLFKSWANIWKLKITQQSSVLRLAVDPHAPSPFRTNMVNNFAEFYDVFGVAEGSPMFLTQEKRISMW